jgi:hypothetical protein
MKHFQWIWTISLLLVFGCSAEMGTDITVGADADSVTVIDTVTDGVPAETTDTPGIDVTDSVAEDIGEFDMVDGDTGSQLACDPGEGCFLDECQSNTDCFSGWCIEHMGQKVCTISCQEECPPGWTCSQVTATDPDVTFICVSDFANLCRPCTGGTDCEGIAGTEDACVSYGDEGAFCGGKCGPDKTCPWGFACQQVTTVDGIEVEQCVAETGLCPCTTTAVELGLFTYCEVTTEYGTCQGKRVCTEEGLSDCDAPLPASEVCNGLDDDCNGLIDELDQDTGTPVCDDGNPCTLDVCDDAEGCLYEDLNEGECLDGDACTIGDHCDSGTCIGQPIQCDDGDVCTEDLCDGLGGCTTEFNTAGCDDGDPCTVNDTCSEGTCSGYTVDCECAIDADCQPLEDDDLCNGTLVCNTSKLPHLCTINPETVVTCPLPDPGSDAICLAVSCDPETGACSLVPDHEGYACDDGDACTIGDTCIEGVCSPGVPQNCNDGNLCTDDTCEPDTGCVYADNTAPCNDGDFCTANDTCADGACVAGGALPCDDGNVCNGTETCHPDSGCLPGQPLACDDGNICNGIEACNPETGCDDGIPLVCDDGNLCNGDETCNQDKGCQPGTPLACDDSNPCNGEETCLPAEGCQPGEELECEDENPCTVDSCEPGQGCLHTPNQANCEDGNMCTTGDLCVDGECQSGSTLNCDDDNLCTTDICIPDQGCIHMLNDAPCDDKDVCTTGDHCELGECISSGMLSCNDNNPCTNDSCDPINGCGFVPNDATCSDANECTTGDHCNQGLCVPTDMLTCVDGNECTDDTCDPGTGCLYVNSVSDCDDGNPCTDGDQCLNGSCEPGVDLQCDDGHFCNGEESCVEDEGCVDGTLLDLDDNVDCTLDTCDEENDVIVHTPLDSECDNDLFCDGSETCHPEDGCQDGTPPVEDDDNPCTIDVCDEESDQVTHDIIEPKQYVFSTCGQTGYTGPNQGGCDGVYAGGTLAGQVTVNAGIQSWTVPKTGTYTIQAVGAGGGRGKQNGTASYSSGVAGKGARMSGRVDLTEGDILRIIVGQKGQEKTNSPQKGGGGGGGSFVVTADGTPLVVAGGGGGSGRYNGDNGDDGVTAENGTSGNGANGAAGGTNGQGGNVSGCSYGGNSGAGINGNGKSDCGNSFIAKSYTNGGNGSDWNHCWNDGNYGGFGGGGATGPHGGGGGGGYSGGGGGGDINCGGNGGGGGGGSFNSGADQDNQPGYQSNSGSVTVSIACE